MTDETMRAVEITEHGGPEVLKIGTRPVPVPAAGEVVIKLHAAGVNRPDAIQRSGGYPPPKGASDLPGLEGAGEIVAIGRNVGDLQVGDQVCALLPGGGYAEYVATPAVTCMPVPKGYSMIQAAALCETFFTVWSNVFQRAKLKAGETFLVHGGSSGIGTTAIQLASARGARVFTTAGTDEKCDTCRKLGAEVAINYKEEDWAATIKEATQGRGVDVILDMVGGDYIPQNVRALAMDGRLVNIAFLQGPKAEVNFAQVMVKRLTMTGSTLRPQSNVAKAQIAQELRDEVWPLLDAGRIAPVIDSTFPLELASQAHTRMESNAHIGKIVLTMD